MFSRDDVKKAIAVLMLSPMYFRMTLPIRKALVEEFCTLHLQRTA